MESPGCVGPVISRFDCFGSSRYSVSGTLEAKPSSSRLFASHQVGFPDTWRPGIKGARESTPLSRVESHLTFDLRPPQLVRDAG